MNFSSAALVLGLTLMVLNDSASGNSVTECNNETSNWIVEFKDGAEGSYEIDNNIEGRRSAALKIVKKNEIGYILMKSKNPLDIKNNSNYTLKCYYHAENAPVSSVLLMRLGAQNIDKFNNPYGFYFNHAQSLIPNSLPGEWQKRVLNFTCSDVKINDCNTVKNYPENSYAYLILYGNPLTIWVDNDYELTPQRKKVSGERLEYVSKYNESEVLDILKKRNANKFEIELKNRQEFLCLNGKPMPPIFYMASENNKLVGDFEGFSKAGINTSIIPIRFYDVKIPENSIWTAKNPYNFSVMDNQIMVLLKKNPYADIIISFSITPYPEWGNENPDECWMDKNGFKAYRGLSSQIKGFANKLPESNEKLFFYPSYNSEKWKKDTENLLAAALEHIKQSPYRNVITGFYFFSGIDGRLQIGPADYSPSEEKMFKKWCVEKYRTVEKISSAWNIKVDNWDQVGIRTHKVFPVLPSDSNSTTPYNVDIPSKDYLEYRIASIWALLDSWGKLVKEKWVYPVVTFVYRDLEEDFLRTKYIDVCGNDLYYPHRRSGYAGASWYPVKTDFLGKYWMMDIDLRSYAGPQIVDEEYTEFIGGGFSEETWIAIHDKLTGMCLAKNTGYWYYDMLAYFQNPEILKHIRDTFKIAQKLEEKKKKDDFSPDVAVVIKGHSRMNYSVFNNITSCTIGEWGFNYIQGMMLGCSGVPYDMIYLDDLLKYPDLQKYKVYVFLQIPYLSDAERIAINETIKNGGRTIVWVHDVGYISEHGKDVKAMSNLIGMNICTEEKFERLTPLLIPEKLFTEDALSFQGGGELMHVTFSLKGLNHGGIAASQPFWIQDNSVESFAAYKENGKIAMAYKKFKDWNSIYLAAPNSLGGDLLNNIAKYANAYICGRAGQNIFMNGNFMSLHGMKSEQYKINLPVNRTKVLDPYTNEVLSEGKSTFTFDVKAGKTYWMMFE